MWYWWRALRATNTWQNSETQKYEDRFLDIILKGPRKAFWVLKIIEVILCLNSIQRLNNCETI